MHVSPAVRAGIFLNTEHFGQLGRVLNLTTDVALSRAIGVTERTINRARGGQVGEQFIAATLAFFKEHEEELARYRLTAKFEDLFEVGEKAVSA